MKQNGLSLVRIALVGDHDANTMARQAIVTALTVAGESTGIAVDADWLTTESIVSDSMLNAYEGIWCVPGNPYRNLDGVLRAIAYARRSPSAFLGTGSAFHLVLLEYARSVLRWSNATHAQYSTEPGRLLIAPLEAVITEPSESLNLMPGTLIADAYGDSVTLEPSDYCFELNSAFRSELFARNLIVSALTSAGNIRAVELGRHPFFVATQFQPERSSFKSESSPIIEKFVRAAFAMAARDRMINDAYPKILRIAKALRRERPGSTILTGSLVADSIMNARWVTFNDEDHLKRYLRIIMRFALVNRWNDNAERDAAFSMIAAEFDQCSSLDLELTSGMIDYQQAMDELATMDPVQADIVARHELGDETLVHIAKELGLGRTKVNAEYSMGSSWIKARLRRGQ